MSQLCPFKIRQVALNHPIKGSTSLANIWDMMFWLIILSVKIPLNLLLLVGKLFIYLKHLVECAILIKWLLKTDYKPVGKYKNF